MGLGGGAFVLAALIERIHAEGAEKDKEKLEGWFDENHMKSLRESEFKGKKVLLDALDS